MTDRKATTVWEGNLADGKGTATLETSGLTSFEVSWPARAEEAMGRTSPEELLAAAHSACFSMAFSGQLTRAGFPPERMETSAVVTFEPVEGGGYGVTRSAITVRATVPGVDADLFQEKAEAAKDGCPISKALNGNLEITVDAELLS